MQLLYQSELFNSVQELLIKKKMEMILVIDYKIIKKKCLFNFYPKIYIINNYLPSKYTNLKLVFFSVEF